MNLISPVGNRDQRMGVHGPLNISEVGPGHSGAVLWAPFQTQNISS
jgi:hypothetical protein